VNKNSVASDWLATACSSPLATAQAVAAAAGKQAVHSRQERVAVGRRERRTDVRIAEADQQVLRGFVLGPLDAAHDVGHLDLHRVDHAAHAPGVVDHHA
jgi:hypothetical protein